VDSNLLGKGFEWRGKGRVGSKMGSWYNPTTKESWYPNLNHPPPIGSHWDYCDSDDNRFRVFKYNSVVPV